MNRWLVRLSNACPAICVLVIILGLLICIKSLPDGSCEAKTPGMTEAEYEEWRLEMRYQEDGVILSPDQLFGEEP